MVALKYEGQPLPRDHGGRRACSCRISTLEVGEMVKGSVHGA